MDQGVEGVLAEMLDISTDIDKAVLFSSAGVLASNMPENTRQSAVAQAKELVRLGQARAAEMGSQPLTQLVVKTQRGLVCLARETEPDGMTILVTARKGSPIGLVLYDLQTCLRDAREVIAATESQAQAHHAQESGAAATQESGAAGAQESRAPGMKEG